MKTVKIDGKSYKVLQSEFNERKTEYCNLHILENVGYYDRIASLISAISNKIQCKSVVFGSITHGGYIPINCTINTSFLFDCSSSQQDNITSNIENNKQYVFLSDLSIINEAFVRKCILYTDSYHSKYDNFVAEHTPIIISNNPYVEGYVSHTLLNASSPTFVLIPTHLQSAFASAFSNYLTDTGLNYDNLLNLCVMVKNGGNSFVSMLELTLPFIDRWTILDTGSTDDTVANVRRIMAGKDGALYQEPFVNFSVSRNRCLELAGTQCTYNIMLDDTYHLKGDLRKFLQFIRGDQHADSFSIYITQLDIQYASNRIFKSKRNLKYKYAIHEVIDETNNMNIIIPNDNAYIYDFQTDELSVRTASRKQQDLDMLQQEIDSNPDDPRPYYYMAQTYNGMEQFEKAYEWFLKRIYHTNAGFEQEKHEACLEAGRIAQFILKYEPTEYLKLYELAHVVDPERPDALYFIGLHYYNLDVRTAFNYLLKGFRLGFPEHRQYCLKPSITYIHIPKLLTECCYSLNEYKIGDEASSFYLKYNKCNENPSQDVVLSWNKIFKLLVHSMNVKDVVGDVIFPSLTKPICCFIAPCGLYNWTGSDILKNGMGGSESMIVEMATHIQAMGKFNVIVFCNCDQDEMYENVRYITLPKLFQTLHSHFIHTCIISRYSEYLPVVLNSEVENIYLMAHDIAFSGNVITANHKLKGIICLSKWHSEHITTQFPTLQSLIKIIGHGIDVSKLESSYKIPFKFIYSSLANRGLYDLLLMWPKIMDWQPSARLHIYSNIDSQYMLDSFGDKMAQIRGLIENTAGVVHHGLVNKQTLYESWKTADVWFYPTAFDETFCVTALEAAASKTLAIATNVAALKETVSNRGILIDKLDDAVEIIIRAMENVELKKSLVDSNYEWATINTWNAQSLKLEKLLMDNIFEHRGVFNWSYHEDSRKRFIEIFQQFIKPSSKILEIGVGTGISLLTMMDLVKDSTGIAIYDCPSANKLMCSFDANFRYVGFIDRVIKIPIATTIESLVEVSKMNNLLDVIYFNNKSNLLDCYSEINIAWTLLKVGGILIVENLIGARIEAVQHLINKLKNTSVLWKDSQRIFIIKT